MLDPRLREDDVSVVFWFYSVYCIKESFSVDHRETKAERQSKSARRLCLQAQPAVYVGATRTKGEGLFK